MPDIVATSAGTLFLFQPKGYNPNRALDANLGNTISNVIGIITFIAGISFVFYFMFGALNLITAAGDTQKVQTAKLMITNAIVGLVITVIAYPVIYIIANLLGVPFTNPTQLLNSLKF